MDALTEVESEVIDMDDTEEVENENEACLLGRLVTTKNWNPSNLIDDITKAWKPKHGMSSRELGESKLILFRFDDAIERDWVLKNQPWILKGTLFAIEMVTVGNEQQLSSLVNVTVKQASFWVRLYDVPFSCMTERSLGLFAKQIGILEYVDIWGEDLIGTFIRFKVSMNITKPLLRGITVRVKGKHLWLPLKYELLPIYCFSCGTIGHDYKNCQSYNRNLKYSTLKLKGIEERKDTPTTLSHDIIENILSRLPAKHLIRLKLVCKQWEATISDPRFAEIHLQEYKKSSSHNLLAWEQLDDLKGLYVAEILNNHFEYVSVIPHSRKYSLLEHNNFLCHSDGLYLIFFDTADKGRTYLLWNPSCRAYKEIRCPQSLDDCSVRKTLYGICYNPLMKDYKVVIAGVKHYAVFSCRYNKWSEVRKMQDVRPSRGAIWNKGLSFNGSFYWLMINKRDGSDHYDDYKIVYFDWKVEKFKKICLPDCNEQPDGFYLTSSESHLFLFLSKIPIDSCKEMRFWKKVKDDEKDSWTEFKVQPEFGPMHPICCVNEGEIMFEIRCSDSYYLLYDQSNNTCVKIHKSRLRRYNDHPVVYRENLFLQ